MKWVIGVRVLVVGAEKLGVQVIKQLKKRDDVEILVADVHENPAAVTQGVIEKVDILAHVTAMNFEEIVGRVKPDFVVLARTISDWQKSDVPMGGEYVLGMERELTKYGTMVLPADSRILGPY
ncbi:MAG TPA: hypothetical protein VMW88_03350 [Thermoplasmata archaeon]|nr:hypothetical protein [Thermoplasmata archaeon]